MRHRCGNDKLGRSSEDRKALLRSLVQALFKSGKIKTTMTKAKNLRKVADKFITLAKKGDLSARRRAITLVNDKKVVHDLFANVSQYEGRNSGYTRIIPMGLRKGDAASQVLLELISG